MATSLFQTILHKYTPGVDGRADTIGQAQVRQPERSRQGLASNQPVGHAAHFDVGIKARTIRR